VVAPATGDPPTTEDVFALLEYLLSRSAIRLDRRAKPVFFDVLPDHQIWSFDPRGPGPFFRQGELKQAPPGTLVLHCEGALLVRLVKDDHFALREDDTAWFDGNPEDLLPIAEALEQGGGAIGLRARKKDG
jgi:hypothetical protein